MIIIGAGMSGMLAGQFFRSQKPRILEKQKDLPNNHKALLRFRSDAVSNLSGIDFKCVRVTKAVSIGGKLYNESNISMNNKYSRKVTGSIGQRSISNLEPVYRYIAPSDFIQKLSHGLNIEFSTDAKPSIMSAICNGEPVISTMPVQSLAKVLGYDDLPALHAKKVIVLKADIEDVDCDVYQTIYFPDTDTPLYRMSITGSHIIAEFVDDECSIDSIKDFASHALYNLFGIDSIVEWTLQIQEFGKLVPHSGSEIKRFMGWATQTHNIYSLGRWGTHRQILMDDVVNDLHVINRMIKTENYER